MMPISYALPEVMKRRFAELLRLNGISAEPSADGQRYLSAHGEEVLVLRENLLETAFNLPDEEDMLLHAVLMCSGAKHFGNEALERWPARMLAREGHLVSAETLERCLHLEASSLKFKGNSGAINMFGCSFILAVRATTDDELQSFVVLSRLSSAGEHTEAWERLGAKLKEQEFLEMPISMNPRT